MEPQHRPSTADGHRDVLEQFCLNETDLKYMGARQRRLVEEILFKVAETRTTT